MTSSSKLLSKRTVSAIMSLQDRSSKDFLNDSNDGTSIDYYSQKSRGTSFVEIQTQGSQGVSDKYKTYDSITPHDERGEFFNVEDQPSDTDQISDLDEASERFDNISIPDSRDSRRRRTR